MGEYQSRAEVSSIVPKTPQIVAGHPVINSVPEEKKKQKAKI